MCQVVFVSLRLGSRFCCGLCKLAEFGWVTESSGEGLDTNRSRLYSRFAWCRRDALLADKWFAQVKRPKLIQPLQRIRIEVAVSFGRGDLRAALEKWQQGLEYIENLPEGVNRESLTDSWLEWREKIEERNTAETTT